MLPRDTGRGTIRKVINHRSVDIVQKNTREEYNIMAKPTPVTDETFEAEVLDAGLPVLVDFWAEWCGPCKMIAPIVDELAEEYEGSLVVRKLDADENPSTMQAFGIMGIPTLILFKGGEAVERITGFMPKEKLVDRLTPYLS
jgi:thioredoxin 1